MKFQTKIFLLFLLSIILTLFSTISFVYYLLEKHNSIYENKIIEDALSEALGANKEEPGHIKHLYQLLVKINSEYVKSKILKTDILINGITSLGIFLFLQAIVLLLLISLVIRAVTSQLEKIYNGIKAVKAGKTTERFPELKGREFAVIGEAVNRMLDDIEKNAVIIKEQSKLAGWQEVSAFLSHQLKNPLTSIALAGKNIELCWQHPDRKAQVEENLAILSEESGRINALVNRLKELSSFPQLSREKVVINQVIRRIAGQYPEQKVKFHFSFSPVPFLSIDKQLIDQMFINLFTNSIEAQIEIAEIFIQTGYTDNYITLAISDSVTGLSADILSRLFIPKFTTKKNGTGLGLQFVKRIVILHQGDISVSLSANGGLLFHIRFPVDLPAEFPAGEDNETDS